MNFEALRSVTFEAPCQALPSVDQLLGARPTVVISGAERTILGWGEAATVSLAHGTNDAEIAEVVPRLAGIDLEDPIEEPGSGPIALGALAFQPLAPASLSVPRTVVVMTRQVGSGQPGRSWVTVTGPKAEPWPKLAQMQRITAQRFAALSARGHRACPHGSHGDIPPYTAVPKEHDYLHMIEAALDALAARTISKVVLARRVDVVMDCAKSPAEVAACLRVLEPDSTVFAFGTSDDGFAGASPELLVSRRGPEVRSYPLAGTTARSGHEPSDERAEVALLDSPKEATEHKAVVEALSETLGAYCKQLEVPPRPGIVRLRTVAHLGTPIRGLLSGSTDALSLAAALHPTPAVAGSPLDAAMAVINWLEPTDRGRYAGPVGWVDSRGDGDFFVGIRAVALAGKSARLHAGAGIVEGSDPAAELAETEIKLRSVLCALA